MVTGCGASEVAGKRLMRTPPLLTQHPLSIARVLIRQCTGRRRGTWGIIYYIQNQVVHCWTSYFLPSTMIMWYPCTVLTRSEVIGLSGVEGCSAKAASWNAPTIDPLRSRERSYRMGRRRGGRTEPSSLKTHQLARCPGRDELISPF